MSAKESWVRTTLLNFVLEEEKKIKLHFKIPHTQTVLLGISQTRHRERQVPKKGTHTPALLPEAGYILAFKSYVKLGRPQTVSWR